MFKNNAISLIKSYIALTKPGIIFGNTITAAAGFFLASKGHINFLLFFVMLVGLSLGIASACVINNYIDRGIDRKMERTKNRALVTGVISGRNALLYALLLGFTGVLVLAIYTNFLTIGIGLVGGFFYLIMYTIWKRRSVYGTIVGSISGAVPPVAGYCAVTNHLDIGAVILFFILATWQMPHFYAIALYRLHDYADAAIPVLPVVKGIYMTKLHMVFYIIAFIIATLMLPLFGYTGYVYVVIITLLGFTWLGMGVKELKKTDNNRKWARKMFIFSLIILLVLCIMVSIEPSLPFKRIQIF